MKSRSRSFYKTSTNNNSIIKNENSKSVSMSHSNIKTKMYVPGEKLKQSKNKIKLLSSQPIIHSKSNNEQINNSLKHLEYNYENLMALSLKGMNSIQTKTKQTSNINNNE